MLARLLLTAGGLGHLRPAPGTWGSLPPVVLAVILAAWFGRSWFIDLALLLLAIIFTLVCLKWGEMAEGLFGRKDPSQVVADEVAGQAVALLFLPWRPVFAAVEQGGFAFDDSALRWNLTLGGIAFLAFRGFDILKPPPADALQRFRGGLGIVIDDLFAGVYALLAVHAIVWLLLVRMWV